MSYSVPTSCIAPHVDCRHRRLRWPISVADLIRSVTNFWRSPASRMPVIASYPYKRGPSDLFWFRQVQEYEMPWCKVLSFTEPFSYQSAFRSVEVEPFPHREGEVLRRVDPSLHEHPMGPRRSRRSTACLHRRGQAASSSDRLSEMSTERAYGYLFLVRQHHHPLLHLP